MFILTSFSFKEKIVILLVTSVLLKRNMSKRVHLLVSLAREKYEGNVTLNVSSQCKELQPPTLSSSSPIVPIIKNEQIDYFNSPIQSNECDYDDSDKDPNFELPANITKQFFPSIIPSSTSSSTSSSSSASSINDSTSSSSDIEDENVDISQNPAMPEVHEQEAITEEKKGKKRVRKLSMWKTKVAKVLRNSGKAYHSLFKLKKQVPERKIRSPCANNCRLSLRHVQEIKPKYRYSSTQNLRALNSSFYFEMNGSKVRVCKTFFKSNLDLNDRVIKTTLSKKTELGVIEGELRGKHSNQPTIDPQIKQSVLDFINSIPRIESHYLRAQTTREFISSDKCLADLYRGYKSIREKNRLPWYQHLTEYSILISIFHFLFQKKDQCDVCECYKNAKDEEKRKLYQNYAQHLKEKTLARIEKENDKGPMVQL
ncbi:hypothetical protein QTP88_008915 [Uroleucon formosanum]